MVQLTRVQAGRAGRHLVCVEGAIRDALPRRQRMDTDNLKIVKSYCGPHFTYKDGCMTMGFLMHGMPAHC
jgi:hypothetical protein